MTANTIKAGPWAGDLDGGRLGRCRVLGPDDQPKLRCLLRAAQLLTLAVLYHLAGAIPKQDLRVSTLITLEAFSALRIEFAMQPGMCQGTGHGGSQRVCKGFVTTNWKTRVGLEGPGPSRLLRCG